ncbi:hypothetical protein ONR57_09060 [Hoyosella sp. YIM 151337]|uniref:hypothetical protein n=1 Tax=Hoyosella sp. YIM 151337 TaxID=2992742 RepID=UPI0022363D51|nr:hypothetical protein [Hoyosella sp. YIM 151337]MCW4353444.1 hypothetical protein [Hoyosella sp. YIM 151337]
MDAKEMPVARAGAGCCGRSDPGVVVARRSFAGRGLVRARGTTVALALCAAVLLVVSCSGGPGPVTAGEGVGPQPSTPAVSSSAASEPDAVTSVVEGVTVEVQLTGAADHGRSLAVSESSFSPEHPPAHIASTTPVSVRLDDGDGQPTAPIQLAFDLSDRPDLVAAFNDGAVPVVESVSGDGAGVRDMFLARWEPTTQTVTSEVTHLSNFWVSAFNVVKVVTDDIGKLVTGFSDRFEASLRCRESSTVTFDNSEYVLTPAHPGQVSGCLVNANGRLAVDFQNATGSFYAIRVDPDEVGGSWAHGDALTMTSSAGALATLMTVGSKGTLVGRSTGRLTFSDTADVIHIRLIPQEHGILAQSLVTGINMLGIDLERIRLIPGAWDCFALLHNAPGTLSDLSPASLYSMIGEVSQCLITLAEGQGGDQARMAELHRLSVAVAAFIQLPQRLWDHVVGGFRAIGNDSVKYFDIRRTADTPASTTPATSPAAPTAEVARAIADRITVDTWAYDRVAEDTYTAANNNTKTVYVHVASFAGDQEVSGGRCSTTESPRL